MFAFVDPTTEFKLASKTYVGFNAVAEYFRGIVKDTVSAMVCVITPIFFVCFHTISWNTSVHEKACCYRGTQAMRTPRLSRARHVSLPCVASHAHVCIRRKPPVLDFFVLEVGCPAFGQVAMHTRSVVRVVRGVITRILPCSELIVVLLCS
jgi:hypothetical protein